MPTQAKIEQVQAITSILSEASAMWLVDYRGLTVKQTESLRRALRESGAELKIYKNNLAEIAMRNLELPEMKEYLKGPNGFVFATGDVAQSAKAIKVFAKANPTLEIKGGLLDGRIMTPEQVMAIAELPSREELIARLLGTMNNPMTKIVRVLNEPMACVARAMQAVADSKSAA